MPEVKEHYDNLEERQDLVKMYEDMAYRMLHDDFDDPNWKHGDPEVGTMTFTNEPELVIEPPTFRDLEADIDKLIARVEKLEKKVK